MRLDEATVRALGEHAKSTHPLNNMVMAPELVDNIAADWLAMRAVLRELPHSGLCATRGGGRCDCHRARLDAVMKEGSDDGDIPHR